MWNEAPVKISVDIFSICSIADKGRRTKCPKSLRNINCLVEEKGKWVQNRMGLSTWEDKKEYLSGFSVPELRRDLNLKHAYFPSAWPVIILFASFWCYWLSLSQKNICYQANICQTLYSSQAHCDSSWTVFLFIARL